MAYNSDLSNPPHHILPSNKMTNRDKFFYTGTGCKYHNDCRTCPYEDCIVGKTKDYLWANTILEER